MRMDEMSGCLSSFFCLELLIAVMQRETWVGCSEHNLRWKLFIELLIVGTVVCFPSKNEPSTSLHDRWGFRLQWISALALTAVVPPLIDRFHSRTVFQSQTWAIVSVHRGESRLSFLTRYEILRSALKVVELNHWCESQRRVVQRERLACLVYV